MGRQKISPLETVRCHWTFKPTVLIIFLLGFMGAGKTTQGKNLSRLLEFDFVDLDHLIEIDEGKTIPEIFEHSGEQYFREIEATCLRKLEGRKNLVVSLGGGTPCFSDNMIWMNEHGITIYLKMDAQALRTRLLKSKTNRPLLKDKTHDEILDYIRKTLHEREKYYLMANFVTEARNLKTEGLKKLITKFI